jgi:hypothetical protein
MVGRLVALGFALSAFMACSGQTPTTPTTPVQSAPSSTGDPRPVRSAMRFDVTGTVTDEEGAAVLGAGVEIWSDYQALASATTDAAGTYRLEFTGVPGSNYVPGKDPAGTEDAIAFLQVDTDRTVNGFERYARYLLGGGEHLVENIRLRRIKRIAVGESVSITMDRADTVCVLDVWPGRESICGIARLIPTKSGLLRVQASAGQGAGDMPQLTVYSSQSGVRSNPAVLQVSAGTEYHINVERPWAFSGPESFIVSTSVTTP